MEDKTNNKGIIVLIVMLVLIILGLMGFIVYDKVLSTKNLKQETTTTSTSTTTTSINNTSKVNEEEKELHYDFIKKAINNFITEELNEYDIKYNSDYMLRENGKYNMVWSFLLNDDSVSKTFDIDLDGNDISGGVIIDWNIFKEYYNNIIRKEPVENEINNIVNQDIPKIKNNKIYGTYPTGPSEYMIKLNSISKTNDIFEMKIDYAIDTESDKFFEEYTKYSTTETFSDDLIDSIIDIKFTYTNNNYQIKSLIVQKK